MSYNIDVHVNIVIITKNFVTFMPVMVMSMYHYFCLSHITKNVSTGSEPFVLLLQQVDDPFYCG